VDLFQLFFFEQPNYKDDDFHGPAEQFDFFHGGPKNILSSPHWILPWDGEVYGSTWRIRLPPLKHLVFVPLRT
jgi:hypothetical protein